MPPVASRAEPSLELRDVSKFFGDHAALKSIRLEIHAGDSIFLYGPNGAGKTTLLRLLASLSRATLGEVLFNGRPVERTAGMAQRAVGFASHQSLLYGELTVRENLRFFGSLFGMSGLAKRIEEVLELFNLRDRGGSFVRDLSRGLLQRVTLARAMLHDPTFLLLDEPFTGLDAKSVNRLEEILRRLPGEGKGLLFSTHSFEQGAPLAKRLLMLEAGRMKYLGPLALAPLDSLGITGAAPSDHE